LKKLAANSPIVEKISRIATEMLLQPALRLALQPVNENMQNYHCNKTDLVLE
jgi:hypothetical protein